MLRTNTKHQQQSQQQEKDLTPAPVRLPQPVETLRLVHILPVVVSQHELIVSCCKRCRLPGEPAAAPVSLERGKDDRYCINLFLADGNLDV